MSTWDDRPNDKEPPLTEDQALSYWTIMQRYGEAKQFRHAIIEECARAIELKPGGVKWACYIRALKEKK